MSILDSIEKLITEHGSAAILGQQLAFAKEQFLDLERKVADLQTQVGRLDAQLERERSEHKQTQQELQRLEEEHEEETRIHRSIEFRKGKRTVGKWVAFCPKCHMPASNRAGSADVNCTDEACMWHVVLEDISLSQVVQELGV